ncbi:MAG: hypothetical protein ACK4SA_19865 [Caldilinea sp.]
MLPNSHIAYTWLALDLAQEWLGVEPEADYRLIAIAAAGPDLIDKPLAAAYFYRRYKSAVLFAHTLLVNLLVLWATLGRFRSIGVYAAAFLGHALLDPWARFLCDRAVFFETIARPTRFVQALSKSGVSRCGTHKSSPGTGTSLSAQLI